MDDAQCVAKTLAGDHSAYELLVTRWTSRVLALCRSRVRRLDVAEDLAQEALLRGYRNLPGLRDPEKFGPWLLGIANLVCRDWGRSRHRREVPWSSLGETAPSEAQTLDDDGLERSDELHTLLDHVEQLPEDLREVIVLYYTADVTYEELATTLGVSAATVNARLTKARALLRRRLTRLEK